jgi:hypothetical protein
LAITPSAYAHGDDVLFAVIFSFAATYLVQIVFLTLARSKLKIKLQCGMAIAAASSMSYLYLVLFTGSFFEDIVIFILLSILSWSLMVYLIYFQKP